MKRALFVMSLALLLCASLASGQCPNPCTEYGSVTGGTDFGTDVAIIGDITGDGIDDYIVGQSGYGVIGHAYIYSGSDGSLIRQHDGQTSGDRYGDVVSGAGLIDSDNIPDYMVGAWNYSDNRGRVYVYSGATGDQIGTTLSDGNSNRHQQFGRGLASGGDWNGDGTPDILIGAPYDHYYLQGTGYIYVPGRVYIFTYTGGSWTQLGFVSPGTPTDLFGMSIAYAGNVNGDQYDDIVVGAPFDDGASYEVGKAYVIAGNSGSVLATMGGVNSGGHFGQSVSGVGDLNGDTYDDVIIGHPGESRAVVMSAHGGFSFIFDIYGPGGSFGQSVSGISDLNNDGFRDFIIGAPYGSQSRVYVYSGDPGAPGAPEVLNCVGVANSEYGQSVSGSTTPESADYGFFAVGSPGEQKAYLYACKYPIADFSGVPTNGFAPLDVTFSDQSTGIISAYQWDFGDTQSSNDPDPVHQYTGEGDYTVSLTVTGFGGDDTATKADYIRVNGLCATPQWDMTYGGTSFDDGNGFDQTSDGGFILGGTTQSFATVGTKAGYLVKVDNCGVQEWAQVYEHKSDIEINSVKQTFDGGYIVTGSYYENSVFERQALVFKTDASGAVQWNYGWGGFGSEDAAYSAIQLSTGGFIAVGAWAYDEMSSSDAQIVKLDGNGGVLWDEQSGGIGGVFRDVVQASNGTIYAVGQHYKYENPAFDDQTDVLLSAFSPTSGWNYWFQSYGGEDGYDYAYGIADLPGDGLALTGYTQDQGLYDDDIYTFKTDYDGNVIWTRTYGGFDDEMGYSIDNTFDGDLVMSGYSKSFNAGPDHDLYVSKLNGSNGDVDWVRIIGLNSTDKGNEVMQTGEGGYAVFGLTLSWGAGLSDFYLNKFNEAPYRAPQLIAPANRAETTNQTPLLDWEDVPGVNMSYVQLADNPQFDNPILDIGTSTDDATAPTLSYGTYYWRVQSGSAGYYSETYSFAVVEPTPPPAPVLLLPVNGQIWYTYGTHVTLDWEDIPDVISYHLMYDTDSLFTEPVLADMDTLSVSTWLTPYYTSGTFYWKVRAQNEVGWGPWSETRWYRLIRKSRPSCPVLFSYDGVNFNEENTILTACEKSNYQNIVDDYYLIDKPVEEVDGQALFQVREMEDEVSYIHDIELITVDHSRDTKVACSPSGEIMLYNEMVAPLSAIDQDGVDHTAEVTNSDGNLFTSSQAGSLIVTFPNTGDEDLGFEIVLEQKPQPCIPQDEEQKDIVTKVNPGALKKQPGLSVQVMDVDDNWQDLKTLPSRQNVRGELVVADASELGNSDEIKIRISWDESYSADGIYRVIASDETPVTNHYRLATVDTDANLALKTGPGFDYNNPLTLKRDHAAEFAFNVEPLSGEEMERSYIVHAAGRYQPDYDAAAEAVPGAVELHNNYPNPFNPTTTISFDLSSQSPVELSVYNVIGQMVTQLVNDTRDAGHYEVVWDGTDDAGKRVASGIYFYTIKTDNFVQTKKMMLMK